MDFDGEGAGGFFHHWCYHLFWIFIFCFLALISFRKTMVSVSSFIYWILSDCYACVLYCIWKVNINVNIHRSDPLTQSILTSFDHQHHYRHQFWCLTLIHTLSNIQIVFRLTAIKLHIPPFQYNVNLIQLSQIDMKVENLFQ